jgi:hypothetical protein
VSDLAVSSHSIQAFQDLRDGVFVALQKAVPEVRQGTPKQQRVLMEDMDRFLMGHIEQADLLGAHPELNNKVHELVQNYKELVAANETELKDLKILAPEQHIEDVAGNPIDEDDLPGYLTKMYARFLVREPGQWAKMFKQDKATTEKVINMIIADVYSKGEYAQATHANKKMLAERHLDFYLGDPSVAGEAQKAFTKGLTDAAGSTKQRRVLKEWEEIALGKIDNGFVRLAESIARQEQLKLQGKLWKRVADDAQLSSAADDFDARQALGHTEQVPTAPGTYGWAAGRYVHPDTMWALKGAPLAQRNAANAVNKFVSKLKWGQTVGNPGSWVTNFFANAQVAMLSNLVDPFTSPLTIGRGMLTFAEDYATHSKAPGLRADVRSNRWIRAMELGIVSSSYSTAEFRQSATEWLKTLRHEGALNGGRINPLDFMAGMTHQGTEKLSGAYGSIDTMWKYSVYCAGLERGGVDMATGKLADVSKAIAFIGDRYRFGMSNARILEQAELEVSRRIHFSSPMLDRVGTYALAGSKWAGFVNPYIKIKTELIRNYAQLVPRITSESGMAANMLKCSVTLAAIGGAIKAKRELAGINQEEVDASFAQAPSAVQRFKPGAMALWSRAENGRLRFTDITQMFEPLTWLQGDPNASAGANAFANAATLIVDGSILEEDFRNIGATAGLLPEGYRKPRTMEWQASGAKMLGKAITDLGPGIIRNTYNTLNRGPEIQPGPFTPPFLEGLGTPPGRRGPQQEQQSQSTTNINLLAGPNRIFEVGGTQAAPVGADAMAALQRKSMEIKELERQLAAIGPMHQGQSLGIAERLDKPAAMAKAQAILEKKVQEMQLLQKQISDLGK